MKPQTVVIAVIAVAVIAVLAYGALDSENGDGSSDGPITNENGGTISVGPFVSNIDMGALIPVTEHHRPGQPYDNLPCRSETGVSVPLLDGFGWRVCHRQPFHDVRR